MIEEFNSKLKGKQYISNYLYEKIKEENRVPEGFNLEEYNKEILDKMYTDNKEYFEGMYKGIDDNIHLDEEQCKAILADEKYSLIIAGAGTGKTTTMVSKVKYLIDKKGADPKRILVMSYTRKATEELANRININYNSGVDVKTFHSLGYDYIQRIYTNKKINKNCLILDSNKKKEIQLNYFKKIFEDKKSIEEIIKHFKILKEQKKIKFIFSKYFMDNYMDYKTYDEFIEAYVSDKMNEARKIDGWFETLVDNWINRQEKKADGILTLNREYVKSAGEMRIANYLFKHQINYGYEELYEELYSYNNYRPDFTIKLNDGEKIYIEYFGLDNEDYNKQRKWKNNLHRKDGNKYIEIERASLDQIEEVLSKKLLELGIKGEPLSNEQIYEHILRANPISQVYPFLDFLHKCMLCRSESSHREDKEIVPKFLKENPNQDYKIQYKYINDYINFYSNEVYKKEENEDYYFNFSDLLYFSTKEFDRLTTEDYKYDYIIIDEYQDISEMKYKLTRKTADRNDSKVYAVGDDWQSIYAFSGSKIEYIYEFNKYFKGAKNFNISKTYRNSQELIDLTGEFIMRNDSQIKKQLVSDKHIYNPIVLKYFDSNYNETGKKGKDPQKEIECLKETIREIHKENPDHTILILGRTNSIVDGITNDNDLKDDIGSKITYKGLKDINIEAMTMHKSKGLTFDEVIIIGLNERFPSNRDDSYWYKTLYKSALKEEKIEQAEERRLFYVALTRTKNKVYLLVDENIKRRSTFVNELNEIIKK